MSTVPIVADLSFFLSVVAILMVNENAIVVTAWSILADDAKSMHPGSFNLPPLVSVPIRGDSAPLREMIQPPNVEALYEWYADVRNEPDADPSWAVLWPTAVSLAVHLSSNSNADAIVGKRVAELGCGLGLCGLA